MGLTKKQDKFARLYVEYGDASRAYRESYSCKRMKPHGIASNANKLLNHTDIALLIELLKGEAKKIADKHFGITVEYLLSEFNENRNKAIELGQISAANQATLGKAKLCGLDVYKVDHVSSDGSMSPRRKTLDDFYSENE